MHLSCQRICNYLLNAYVVLVFAVKVSSVKLCLRVINPSCVRSQTVGPQAKPVMQPNKRRMLHCVQVETRFEGCFPGFTGKNSYKCIRIIVELNTNIMIFITYI
jgi:hypothetical protein